MVAVPFATAFTIPVLPMVAIPVTPELQVPPATVLPSVAVPPAHILILPPVILPASGVLSTVTGTTSTQPDGVIVTV